VLCMLVAALVGRAHADPQDDAKAKAVANEGVALFEANDFAGAANKFREAYELNRDPSYLFNVAQAYRLGSDCVRSADYYGRFLATVPHPPNEDQIRVWHASELKCAKERVANDPRKPPPPGPKTQQVPPPTQPATTSPRSRPLGLVVTLAAVGVVGLGVGGFFAWDSAYLNDRRQEFIEGCSMDNRCSATVVNDYDRRGSRANTLAIVGFAAGGAALAASAAVFVLSGNSARAEAPVSVAVTRDGALVTHSLRW
jgi:hypothetical protein